MSRIFLGYPPPKIRQFIEEHYTDWTKVPLHFVAEEAGAKMSFHIADDGIFDEENGEFISNGNKLAEIQTSTDGKNWSDYTSDVEITLANIGDKVYFKAKTSNETISLGNSDVGPYSYSYFTINSGKIAAKGNIMSLLDETLTRVDVVEYGFYELFGKCIYDEETETDRWLCTSLTTAPALPATTLADACYYYMFSGCSSLTQAPELPATTLGEYCYANMFSGCSSLTTAPELPATTLAEYCCSGMFQDCSALTTAPELPATTLADGCYAVMFFECTSLTQAPALPATTLASDCYFDMFYNCTSLSTAPELPATTLAEWCYRSMFQGCSALTAAPKLPATTLATDCYQNMFDSCINLKSAPELPATELADFCYAYMFWGCSSLTQAPELPATTLANGCYRMMFKQCSTLETASFPNLSRETVTSDIAAAQAMFEEAASNIEATCQDGILVINSTSV